MMKILGISSNYTVAYYKPQKKQSNEAVIANVLNRVFEQNQKYAVLVSDLTYVRVGKSGTTSAYLSTSLIVKSSVRVLDQIRTQPWSIKL